jgi:hypothetical protein
MAVAPPPALPAVPAATPDPIFQAIFDHRALNDAINWCVEDISDEESDQLEAAQLLVYKTAPTTLRGILAKLEFRAHDAADFEYYPTQDPVGVELDHEIQTENLAWRLHHDLSRLLDQAGL